MPARSIPKDVERYVKEIKKGNPSYDEAKTWATAWSIYCKYKKPGSDHCRMPTSEYFPGKGGGPLMMRRDYGSEDQASRVAALYLARKRRG